MGSARTVSQCFFRISRFASPRENDGDGPRGVDVFVVTGLADASKVELLEDDFSKSKPIIFLETIEGMQ
jgi:hypothetical protein